MDKAPENTLAESVRNMMGCLAGLMFLKVQATTGGPKKYSSNVELVMAVADRVRGWEIVVEDLFEDRNCIAQLWIDKITGKKLVVGLRRKSAKKTFPFIYLEIDQAQDVVADNIKQLFVSSLEEVPLKIAA